MVKQLNQTSVAGAEMGNGGTGAGEAARNQMLKVLNHVLRILIFILKKIGKH